MGFEKYILENIKRKKHLTKTDEKILKWFEQNGVELGWNGNGIVITKSLNTTNPTMPHEVFKKVVNLEKELRRLEKELRRDDRVFYWVVTPFKKVELGVDHILRKDETVLRLGIPSEDVERLFKADPEDLADYFITWSVFASNHLKPKFSEEDVAKIKEDLVKKFEDIRQLLGRSYKKYAPIIKELDKILQGGEYA